jgi:hypothetical protein
MKRLYLCVVALQVPLFIAAAGATGWTLLALQCAFMVAVFGAIPFTDAMIVRFVDDRIRSRVSGMRLFVSFGVSSAAVWLLGPSRQGGRLRRTAVVDGRDRRDHALRDLAPAVDRSAEAQRAGGTAAAIASRSRLKTPGDDAMTSLVRRNSSLPRNRRRARRPRRRAARRPRRSTD